MNFIVYFGEQIGGITTYTGKKEAYNELKSLCNENTIDDFLLTLKKHHESGDIELVLDEVEDEDSLPILDISKFSPTVTI